MTEYRTYSVKYVEALEVENSELHGYKDLLEASHTTNELLQAENDSLRQENERLQLWVNDLQAGMYINCVYCGHRYGPNDEVPASMADILKEHISQCPEHPMSELKKDNERLQAENERLIAELGGFDDLKLCDCCEGLFEYVTSGDHNQCDNCTELANLQARVNELEGALKVAIDAIRTLPEDSLGIGESSNGMRWPLRDELDDKLCKALRDQP